MLRVSGPVSRARAEPQAPSEQLEVHPVSRVLPIVPLVVRLRPELEVLRLHTEAVMAAMADHRSLVHDSPFKDAEDEVGALGLKRTSKLPKYCTAPEDVGGANSRKLEIYAGDVCSSV